MNILFSKIILSAILIVCSNLSFAQQKIDIKYYVNNTQLPIEDVKIFMVTKFDTITPKIENGKIELTRGFEDNFSLFAQIDGRTIKIGSYRPAIFNNVDGILLGRITDFSIMKHYWEAADSFYIDKEYVVVIPNSENILDVIYCTVKNDINISGISNFTHYAPCFNFTHVVIASKN